MVKKYFFVLLSLFIILIDQITKYLISIFNPNLSFGFLSIIYVTNTGAAFGILKGFQWLFILIALFVLGFLIYYYFKIKEKQYLLLICWSLFIAGLMGNLIDRVFRGFVIDFISVGTFPAFNVADSVLCISVALYIYYVFKG